MNQPFSIGILIIDEIIKQPLFTVEGNIIIWNGNASEQLEALVEEYYTRKE